MRKTLFEKKRVLGWILSVVMFVTITMLLETTTPVQADNVRLSDSSITLEVEEEAFLKLEGVGSKAKVKWSVSKKGIVSLENNKKSNCLVIAEATGKTTVKAKYNGELYKCKITVKKAADKKPAEKETVSERLSVTLKLFDPSSNTYVTRNGEYRGETKDGAPNGEGEVELRNAEGKKYVISGRFSKGKLDGVIKTEWYDDDGTVSSSAFESYDDGEFQFCEYEGVLGKETYQRSGDYMYRIVTFSDSSMYVAHAKAGDGTFYSMSGADVIFAYRPTFLNEFFSFDQLCYVNANFELKESKIKGGATYIEPKQYSKNPSKFDNTIDVIRDAYVFDCAEYTYAGQTVTILYCKDLADQVYVFCLPKGVEIYSGDTVDIWGTLTGEYYYESLSKTTIRSFTGIAYIAEKK